MAGTLQLRLEDDDDASWLDERFAARSLRDHLESVAARAGFRTGERPDNAYLLWDPHYPCLTVATLVGLREECAVTGKPVLLAADGGDILAAVLPSKRAVPGPSQEFDRRPPPADEASRLAPGPSWSRLERQVIAAHLASLAASGVYFEHVESTLVDSTVEIAPGARIGPHVVLRGACRIARAEVHAGAWLEDTVVAEGAVIKPYSVCEDAEVGPGAQVGPMAHLRAGTVLEEDVKVGNFVETKKARLRRGAKASHLTYLGDAEVGEDANVGAGTITCNYDGHRKHETRIGRGAFIGSNSALVAPVRVGDGAMVGAGSVVTRDVPDGALAVERAPLRILEGRGRVIDQRNRQAAAKKDPP